MTKILYCLFIFFPLGLFGQVSAGGGSTSPVAGNLKKSLLALKAKSDSIGANMTTEKLYLQFDKPYYTTGDTIWFKAYLLNGFLAPSDKSAILNIDIANDSSKVVGRYRLPVVSGVTWGNVTLDGKYFPPGAYTLRAYTNWMRNFGEEAFFYKTFTVSGADNGQLLVNASFGSSMVNGNASMEARLRFNALPDKPFAAQPVTLRVLNENKSLYRQKYVTGVDGGIDVNFALPQKLNNLLMVAENDKRERLAVIPVPVNRPQNADVQFLPEGGRLVAGLPAHIAFKAIGEDGRGLEVSGIITSGAQKQVAAFKSLHNGMGSFDLDVKDGESYTAQVTLPGGATKQYALPPVKSTGTTLSIKNELQSDSLMVKVASAKETTTTEGSYFLIGRARGIVCYAAIVNFNEASSVSKRIAKSLFPGGITHFTLMTASYQPLNERLVYIDRHDDLKIKILTGKTVYGKRDSVGMQLKVTDADGNPVAGNFSMAITDDAQIKPDTDGDENINTHLLLTSDLKGYVEQPGYYLSSRTVKTWQALDNLLLTQGWVGYDWQQVLHPAAIAYQPEREFALSGHVTNVLNNPVKGTHVLLFSKSPAMLLDTVTDNNGKFVFDRFPRVDSPLFVLKAVNKNGKSFNVAVRVDGAEPPLFTKPAAPVPVPWFVNIDSILMVYTINAAAIKQQKDFLPGAHVLKEVKISAKKIIKDSQNLNGSGNADFVMDEKDLEAAGKKTWLQLLQENLKGFREAPFISGGSLKAKKDWELYKYVTDCDTDMAGPEWYFIGDQPVKLIIDGTTVNPMLDVKTFRDLNNYLAHTAEDIKGLEVIRSSKFAAAYFNRYDPIDPRTGMSLTVKEIFSNPLISISAADIAFVEITTRAGHGPAIDNKPGMYIYRSLPFSPPAAFYKPEYTIKDSPNTSDLRSTIDWEPSITTDASGEAKIWFYTADKPSTYTVTIEGTDMMGHLAYKQATIKVSTDNEKTK
jgi:hypothetical protein